MYPPPQDTDVAGFYCEVTAVEDPLRTFSMACGWHRGYFGMQVNSPNERRIIFSVWDSGGEAVDCALKVARGYTQRMKIISANGGYHGHTGLALATGDPSFRDLFGANPEGFVQVDWDDADAMECVSTMFAAADKVLSAEG